jgi:hypothetical protein
MADIITGPWKEVTIAKDGTASSEVDLEGEFRDVQVYSPAIDSATLTVKPSRKSGDTAVQAYLVGGSATGDFTNTTSAKTAAAMNVFLLVCARYVTLVLSDAQTTQARTFYVRGLSKMM